jgi:hypothetical protein
MRSLLSPAACGLLAAVLLGTLSSPVHAQSFQGSLRGTVKDAQGVIPGVTVALTNDANGVARDTVSNNVGEFSFPAVDPGTYVVKATVQGYKTFERKGVRIGTQQFLTLDVTLEIGAIEETITVTADAPLVETSNASVGEVLDSKTMQSLPTVGRNAFLMSVMVPTVVSSGDTHWNRMQDQTGASALSMGGGGVRANNYLLDGFPVTDLANRSSTNPSVEMLEDLRVQIHTYDAEMGRSGGGVFNATARSGSNTLRGSAQVQLRPGPFIGQNFFAKIQGLPQSDEYWRDFAGGVGGPIFKDKTFFWFAAEGYRDGLTQNGNLHFPTAAERLGNFSQFTNAAGVVVPIYDPDTTTSTGTRTQFPGNVIPANRISLVGAALLKALPSPNNGTAVDNGTNNYAATDVLKDAAQQYSLKLDHHFNSRVAASGVWLWQNSHEPQNNYFPDARYAAPSYQLDREIHVLVLNNTYILSPTTVLALRYGMNTFDDNNSLPFDFDTHTLGWSKAFADAIPVQKFPSLSFTGFSGTGFQGKQDRRYYSQGVNGSLTKLAGEHSFKLGADFRTLGVRGLSYGNSAGSYTFNGQYTRNTQTSGATTTGSAIADILLGYPSAGTLTINTFVDDSLKYSSVYVQDDWRVNGRMTLNYGIRLEHETGISEVDNNLVTGFDPGAVSPLNVTIPAGVDPLHPQTRVVTGGVRYAGVDGQQTSTGKTLRVKPSPRVGAVYKLTDNDVLRGGYGMFWAPGNYGIINSVGYAQTSSIPNTNTNLVNTIENPFPNGLSQPAGNSLGLNAGAGSGATFYDPNYAAPRVQQWSVDYQRELPGAMSLGIGYTGARGSDLSFGSNVNLNQLPLEYMALGTTVLTQQVANPFFGKTAAGSLSTLPTVPRWQLLEPYPQYGSNSLNITTSGAHSQYHAAIFQIRKRATGIWGGNFSYTYSRLNDNQVGQGNYYSTAPGILDNYNYIASSASYNPDIDYGLSLLDQPHKVTIAPILQLPFGKGKAHLNNSGVAEYLLGGWSASAIIQIQSGFPIGVSQTNSNNTNGGGQRPNVVSGVDFVVPGDITDRLKASSSDTAYLNLAAFTQAPANTIGNAPRILPGVRSPWRNSVDMGINKEFRTGGSSRATLRLEIINLTNTPWYAALSSTSVSNTGTFGRVATQGNYSRFYQVTFKVSF